MKRVLGDLLVVCFLPSVFTMPTQVYAKSNVRYAKTTVNVRKKPSTKSKIVGRLYWNNKISIIKKVNRKWYMVRYRKKIRYVCSHYFKRKKSRWNVYTSPTNNSFKSFEDADCITDSPSLPQGRLKQKYHLDSGSGVWMIGDRYCVAIGSYYTKEIGVKVDLVLADKDRKHTLKCITADSKADKDTVNQHRIHSDGSLAEFVVKTSALPKIARRMGDVSYAGEMFRGKIVKIKVYF